jgi:hypothetical protein
MNLRNLFSDRKRVLMLAAGGGAVLGAVALMRAGSNPPASDTQAAAPQLTDSVGVEQANPYNFSGADGGFIDSTSAETLVTQLAGLQQGLNDLQLRQNMPTVAKPTAAKPTAPKPAAQRPARWDLKRGDFYKGSKVYGWVKRGDRFALAIYKNGGTQIHADWQPGGMYGPNRKQTAVAATPAPKPPAVKPASVNTRPSLAKPSGVVPKKRAAAKRSKKR